MVGYLLVCCLFDWFRVVVYLFIYFLGVLFLFSLFVNASVCLVSV